VAARLGRSVPADGPIRGDPVDAKGHCILQSGEHWVGEGAKRLRTRPQEQGLEFERTLFYDTKNEMGLRKTYHRAAPDYDHASKIAGHLLTFLLRESRAASGRTPDRVVVTVPASFGLAQGEDTLRASVL